MCDVRLLRSARHAPRALQFGPGGQTLIPFCASVTGTLDVGSMLQVRTVLLYVGAVTLGLLSLVAFGALLGLGKSVCVCQLA